MRTTLDLPADLLGEAERILRSKTDTVILSLREVVPRNRLEELKNLLGQVELDIDLERSGRAPKRRA